jgi:hypothetical protein
MTLQNERFEELLSRQLAAELEPQRGRAEAAFKAQLAAEAAEREARQVAGGSKSQVSWARREVSKPAAWLWTGVPSLIAAGLAIVLTLHFMERPIVRGPDNMMIVEQGNDHPDYLSPSNGMGIGGGDLGGGRIVEYKRYEVIPNQAGVGGARNDVPMPWPPVSKQNPYQLPQ